MADRTSWEEDLRHKLRPRDCEVCDNREGGWPKGFVGTHCLQCHESWTGTRPGHCTVCHETFAGETASNAHYQQYHVHPSECEDLELRDDGFWSIRAAVPVLESV